MTTKITALSVKPAPEPEPVEQRIEPIIEVAEIEAPPPHSY